MAVLGDADRALIETARATIAARYRAGWHVVGAALRTRSGHVFCGVHLEADVGRIAVCAEAVALGRAATEAGDTTIETIVAVYQPDTSPLGTTAVVVAPCGMCREMIADYAPAAKVIVPGDGGEPVVRSIAELLPGKFQRPRTPAAAQLPTDRR